MTQTYEMGFRDGWESAAGKEPMPQTITYPPEGEARDYSAGLLYGRSEAGMDCRPDGSDHAGRPGIPTVSHGSPEEKTVRDAQP